MIDFDIDEILKKSLEVSYNLRDPIFSKMDVEYSSFFMRPKSYFKVLTATAQLYPEAHFLELGTFTGASALAYAYGKPETTIETCDIKDARRFVGDDFEGMNFTMTDCRDHVWKTKPDVLFLDITHNGEDERITMANLERQGFLDGVLMFFDDIVINDEMKKFWAEVKAENKRDITEYGHYDGFGVGIYE